jgi:DNA polymerase-3 subunit delta'
MSFKTISDQERALTIIRGQLKTRRTAHAYLFLGPDGVGRRATALELAKALNCQENEYGDPCDHCLPCQKIGKGIHPDVQTIDFAWQAKLENKDIDKQKVLKIETIRTLQHEIGMKPVESRWKIFLIEPAEKITLDAANCLLKTLEEPPAWTVLILLAKHRENLPATVVSRTQIVRFRPLTERTIVSFLTARLSLPGERAAEVARMAEGSLAAAIALANDKAVVPDTFWHSLANSRLSAAELLAISQQYARNAPEFVDELLAEAAADFRRDPGAFRQASERILAARQLFDRNVNPQLILDTLLLGLRRDLNRAPRTRSI